MRAKRTQKTIASPCSVSGRGYWSGMANTLTFLPATKNSGITFVRSDLLSKPRVSATVDNGAGLSLRTTLARADAKFDMIEHVMAALHGLGIDNVDVLCSSSEMPAMDGSSLPFVLALESAGVVDLGAPRKSFRIEQTIRVDDGDRWIEAAAADSYEVEYRLDYGQESAIGQTTYGTTVSPTIFAGEIAPARTFISAAEARMLQSQGLALHVTHQDLVVFDDSGPVDNRLRFRDECARHKTLDLIGDLALTGLDLIGRITANKSGHQLNAQMAQLLCDTYLRNVQDEAATAHGYAA